MGIAAGMNHIPFILSIDVKLPPHCKRNPQGYACGSPFGR